MFCDVDAKLQKPFTCSEVVFTAVALDFSHWSRRFRLPEWEWSGKVRLLQNWEWEWSRLQKVGSQSGSGLVFSTPKKWSRLGVEELKVESYSHSGVGVM